MYILLPVKVMGYNDLETFSAQIENTMSHIDNWKYNTSNMKGSRIEMTKCQLYFKQ